MTDDTEKPFEKFLLEEYSNIAQAHFKSMETISSFFSYYLLIMSIPLSAIAVVSQITKDVKQLADFIDIYRMPIIIILFCVSFVGFFVFCYIINIRLDVVLYARTVNGIRKYFYDSSDIETNVKLRMRSLPQSPQLPSYFEKTYFFPVVFVFGIVNSLYYAPAEYLWSSSLWSTVIYTPIFFGLHFLIYACLAKHREFAYLKSNILGIDIDGVLNKHREHFCKLLEKNTCIHVNPAEILIMPVHEYSALKINREDEWKVFNDPEYWINMPVVEDVNNRLARFKNTFNLKIYIFTWRSWPENSNRKELAELAKVFYLQTTKFTISKLLLKIILIIPYLNTSRFLLKRFKDAPLKLITKSWLKNNDIKYDKFFFEKGNDYLSDPRGDFNNRFYISRKERIRFFIEDDFEKALKLSYICDIVFLLSHPYNEINDNLPKEVNELRKNMPTNVIRVKDWDEISHQIRHLI
jgi:uncharacterized HAD superfamily protein